MRLIDADAVLAELDRIGALRDFTALLVSRAPTVEQEDESTLIDIFVKDRCGGRIHRVGSDIHDSLCVRDGLVVYYNLQNGEGTGEDGDYTFVTSDRGDLEEEDKHEQT